MESNQKLAYQFQYLKEQRDWFGNQLEVVNVSLSNLRNSKVTIENLKNVKSGEEILIPIGGLFNLKATIKDPEKVLLYVSQDVIIEKNLEDSIEFVDKLIEQHNENVKFLVAQIQKLDANLQGISQQIRNATSQE